MTDAASERGITLRQRAVLVVLLWVGFYVMAAAIMLLLSAVPVVEYVSGTMHPKFDVLCAFGAFVIGISIVPRPDRFDAPGPLLRRTEHPRLFETIDQVAAAANQPPPVEVYLVSDVNAFVTERGGFLGFGRRRVMGLGLPLLHLLSVKQLRAVLAHEFGHFVGGDTALGPWVYRTRGAIARTIENLFSANHIVIRVFALPFEAYMRFFLRVSLKVSRAQEYAADQLAARLEGSRALATSLERIHGASLAYPHFLNVEYGPILEAGFRPPLGSGFAAFVTAPPILTKLENAVAAARANATSDEMDSHPCLRDRLSALALEGAAEGDDTPPAHTLLGDAAATEFALLTTFVVGGADRFTAIQWEDVPTRVTFPNLKAAATRIGPLQGTFAALDVSPAGLAALGARTRPEGPPKAALEAGAFAVAAAVLVRLTELGAQLESPPGEPTRAVYQSTTFAPHPLLVDIAAGRAPASAWAEALATASLAEVAFAPPAS